MNFNRLFNEFVEEAKQVNEEVKTRGGKVVFEFKPEEYVIKDISVDTTNTKKVILDGLAIAFRKELLRVLESEFNPPASIALPVKRKKYNGDDDKTLVASTIYRGKMLNEAVVSEATGKMIKKWTKGAANHFFLSDKLGKNKTEVRYKLIVEARKIDSLDSFKETFFWDYEPKEIERIFNIVTEKVEDIAERFRNSIRGAVSNRFGFGMENMVKKAIKTGNYEGLEWLSPLKDIIALVEDKNDVKITIIKKPRTNFYAFDLELKVPYSKEMLLGIHIKLIMTKKSTTSMQNKSPNFTSSSFELIKKALEKVEIDYSKYVKREYVNKGEKTIVFNTLMLINDLFKDRKNITDPSLLEAITLATRVNEKTSVWAVSYQDTGNITFSEKTVKITKEDGRYVFYNNHGDEVFVINAETGETRPKLPRRVEGEENANTE